MSMKNKNAKAENQLKPVQQNELTIEQHLKNVEHAVVRATGNFEELTAIRTSYMFLRDLALKGKDAEVITPQ